MLSFDDMRVVLVSGATREARTAFLRRIHRITKWGWTACGFFSRDEILRPRDGAPSDLCFLGDLGAPVPGGRGFGCPHLAGSRMVLFGIDAGGLEAVTRAIRFKTVSIIHLDRTDPKQALKWIKRRLYDLDADRIGAFAGVGGLLEISLGTTLHAYRIPLKGQLLSSLQNGLLITFGKALNGRGLVRIAFISAMLKAFSPMGNAIRPMMFIFLQGALFSLPAHLLGWNLFSVLAGSVLMGWLTLGISLSMDYLMYGKSIFDAAQNGVGQAFDAVGFGIPSLSQLLIFAFLLRAALSLTVGLVAYFGNVLPAMSRVARAAVRRKKSHAVPVASAAPKRAPKPAAVAALFGLFRPKFLVAYLLSLLLMRFFTDLSSAQLTTTAIRGLCISYLGFLLMHRIDVQALGARLDKRFGLDLEKSLPIAAKRIGRPPRHD